MRPAPKVKALATRVPLRKAAMTDSTASRRPFPAWIVADDCGVVFSAKIVTPRVRDGLLLRAVKKRAAGTAKPSSDVRGTR